MITPTEIVKNPWVKTFISFGLVAAGIATIISLYDRKRNVELLKLNIEAKQLEVERLKKELGK